MGIFNMVFDIVPLGEGGREGCVKSMMYWVMGV